MHQKEENVDLSGAQLATEIAAPTDVNRGTENVDRLVAQLAIATVDLMDAVQQIKFAIIWAAGADIK